MRMLSLLSSGVLTAVLCSPILHAAAMYTFETLDNANDINFNQLLGINNGGTIVGYFGDGTAVPFNGYQLSSPYGQTNYTTENVPGAVQTQVTGINNNASPVTVGFYIDGMGNNFGFEDIGGSFFQVVDPSTPIMIGVPSTNQLLGINNLGLAVGFYVDANGNAHGYTYSGGVFMAVTLPASFDATSVTATGINDAGVISGFYTTAAMVTDGFIDNGGVFTSYSDPSANGNTMFLGLNDGDNVVGSYVDASGVTHGLLYNFVTNTWQTIDDPHSSATAAFNVNGTTINGINNLNQLVGFYSDGTHVDGFLADPVTSPEPFSFLLTGLGLCGIGLLRRRK